MIILLQLISSLERVFLDYGTGKNRKSIKLSDVILPDIDKSCLIGFHAFIGNDFISSFFRRGKLQCWKTLQKEPNFQSSFSELGDSWDINEGLSKQLEKYVCHLYGYKCSSVNEVSYKMFNSKHINHCKVVDLSLLPPCQQVLNLHSLRANLIAKLWKSSLIADLSLPDYISYGWNEDFNIFWLQKSFPDDLSSVLIEKFDNEGEFGLDEESDYEEDE